MEQIKMKELITGFNHSDLRKKLIPSDIVSGWPCIRMIDRRLCVVIPYFNRRPCEKGFALYPIYCSVTIMWKNPGRILDFTIYHTLPEWEDVDYSKPVGVFKHPALKEVETRGEYLELCSRLYGYYDEMVRAVLNHQVFEKEDEMVELFSKLMEPSLYPYYERINKKFYSNFYRA